MIIATVALAFVCATWAYAWLAPIHDRREERAAAWLERPLLGLPEYAHRLGLTAKECKGYNLPDALKARGWPYPYCGAAELRAWEKAGACDEAEWRYIVPTTERERHS